MKTSAGTGTLTPQQLAGVVPFGRYRIEELLGEGAMGSVYRAFDQTLKRPVALKIPKSKRDRTERARQRFLREAQSAAILLHRNICPVFDVGTIDGVDFIAMGFVAGRPLSDYIENQRTLSQRAVAVVIRKLALAMASAHEKGIVHRDLKPANIMIDSEKEPVIMDFGLAMQANESSITPEDLPAIENRENATRLTQAGAILGTPAYMSPEQVSGDPSAVGPQSDIYSLGVVSYEMLVGQIPFAGPPMSVFSQILNATPDFSHPECSELDPELQQICLKMMAKRGEDRYPDMKSVANALTDYLRGGSATETQTGTDSKDFAFATTIINRTPPDHKPVLPTFAANDATDRGRRNLKPWLLGASGILVALLLSLVLFSRDVPDESPRSTDNRASEVVGHAANEPASINTPSQTDIVQVGDPDLDSGSGSQNRPKSQSNPDEQLALAPPRDSSSTTSKSTKFVNAANSDPLPEGRPIDLLQMVDLSKHVYRGHWERQGHGVGCDESVDATLMAPVAVSGSYEVDLEFTRRTQNDGISLIGPMGEQPGSVVVSGFNGSVGGLSKVDGKSLKDLPESSGASVKPNSIENGRRHRLHVRVDRSPNTVAVNATLDGQRLVLWKGSTTAITDDPKFVLPCVDALGVRVGHSVVDIHKWELTVIRDAGEAYPLGDDFQNPITAAADAPPKEIRSECEEWNGKYYYVSKDELSLAQANAMARKWNARMLTISTDAEFQHWVQKSPGRKYWLSGWRRQGEKVWRDERNRPLQYFNWHRGQPQLRAGDLRLALFTGQAEAGYHDTPPGAPRLHVALEWGEEYAEATELAELKKSEELPTGRSVDLLEMVKLPDHVLRGHWEQRGDTVGCEASDDAMLMFPVAVEGSYEIDCEFTRRAGNENLAIIFPTGNHFGAVKLSAKGNRLSGLHSANGKELQDGSPAPGAGVKAGLVTNGQRCHLHIDVIQRGESLQVNALMNNQRFVLWKGSVDALTVYSHCVLPCHKAIGFLAHHSVVDIHKFELKVDRRSNAYQLGDDFETPITQVAAAPPKEILSQCIQRNGQYYYISNNAIEFKYAHQLAAKLNARLLTISSPEEERFFLDEGRGRKFWLSGWRREGDRVWRDERNRPLRYIGQWGPGQPQLGSHETRLQFSTKNDEKGFHDGNPTSPDIHAVLEWGEEHE